MHQRVRLLAATALPSLLLGVWVTLLALVGAAPASGGASSAGPVAVTPASPARAEGPQRGTASVRNEARRTPVTAVHEAVATDAGSRPPTAPPLPAGAVDFAYERTLLRGEVVGPRQERAPPHRPYGPRSTRAPPSTRSS
ncbi:hypothetical protein ACIBCM_08260 [Streptomyces sp. NPDC051018]|uniref:hypothetical protein n=1 Tax=Streptomyces sp. NPDC051018 TaxID=3365639 RepID=UPI0037BA4701